MDCARLVDAVLHHPAGGDRCFQVSGELALEGLSHAELLADQYAGMPLTRPAEAFVGLVDLEPLLRDVRWSPRSEPLVLLHAVLG